jgi:ribosome-associated protein|tara:strand:- start:749 stop:1141 length:393 start_codon:yes stop_codon:yes gene_type:complete
VRRLNISTNKPTSKNIHSQIVTELDKLKAENIVVIDLKEKSPIADYMIIAAGTSSRHINSMAQKIIEFLKIRKIKKVSTEGLKKSDWVLIDAGDILLHLFQHETREFYNLEKMWMKKRGDAESFMIGSET